MKPPNWLTLCLAFAVLLLLCPSTVLGQGIVTGSISGTVVDASGAVIPGAQVSATHVETNRVFTITSNEAGLFLIARIPPGKYNVRIEAPQFKTVQYGGTEVQVAKETQLGRVQMEIGGKTEVVEVSGAAPLVESQAAQISMTFDAQKVSDLPIGRGIDQLALFLPGVSTAGSVGRGNNNGALFSSNGQRPRSNNFQIDGQGMNDQSVTGPAIFLENSDIVSEYQVMTNYDAAYGRNMGSQVNIITKSGTNDFHGTAFETWRGSTFDSLVNEEKSSVFGYCDPKNPEPGCQKPKVARYVRNMFGGTVGGPIFKDKAWFFASAFWDRLREAGAPITTDLLSPTPNGLAALKAAFPTSAGVGYLEKYGPAVTAGNPVFSGLQTVNVSDGTTTIPVEFGTPSRNLSSVSNVRQFSGRVDVQLTSKDRLFGRYLIDDEISTNLDYGDGPAGFVVDVPSRGQQMGLDWTRQFSNSIVNQVRFNYTRLNVGFENGTTGCNRGDPSACPTWVRFGDGVTLDMGLTNSFPQGRLNNTYQVQDNTSVLFGKHTIKFGGEFNKQRSPSDFLPNYNGVYTFADFDSFIQNVPYRLALGNGDFRIRYKEKDLSFYVQDDWRIRPNFTLTFGLRWEWFQQAINELHRLSVARQTGPNPFWDTSLPLNRTTIAEIPEDKNNFGPVFGFSWSPRDKTVVRGGFRIAYDPAFYNIHLNIASNAPMLNVGTLTQGTDPYVPGLPTSGFDGSAVRSVALAYLPTGAGIDPGLRTQSLVASNFHNPYSEQWNFGIQHEFNPSIVGEIRYLGNHGVGLFQNLNGNPALNALINAGFSDLIPAGMVPCADSTQPGYGEGAVRGHVDCARRNVNMRYNSAFNIYHAFQSRLDTRSFHGLTATIAYTWSHNIDNASDIYATTAAGMLNMPQNPFNSNRGERANSNFDYRHTLGMQLIYDLPFFSSQQGLMGKLLGGWQSNIVYRYSTGQPYTPIQAKTSTLCDPTGTFSTTTDACRPILGNTSAPFNSVGRITDLTDGVPTITNVATGDTGNLSDFYWVVNNDLAANYFGSPFLGVGRNTFTGQPIHAVNLSMQKTTNITERVKFQLRATAFNVLNHQFLGVPGNNINRASTSFGNWAYATAGGGSANIVESGIGRRRLEFGGKIIF